MGRPADQAAARLLRGVECVWRADDQTIDVGIVAHYHQPMKGTDFRGDVCSPSAGAIGVKEISKTGRRVGEADPACVGSRRAEGEADDIVEAIREVLPGNFDLLVGQLLLDAGAPIFTGFGLERGIPEIAKLVVIKLVETRLLDALSVEDAITCISPKSFSVAQGDGRTDTRDDTRAEIGVGFGACTEIQGHARTGQVLEVQESTLIVAANVSDIQGGYRGILYFVLIAGGGAKLRQKIARLCAQICAVVLIVVVGREITEFRRGKGCRIGLRTEGVWVGGVETLFGIKAVLAVVRFTAADLVMPMGTGREVPVGARIENMECIALVAAGRLEDGFAGNSRFAGVVAQRKAKLVSIAEGIPDVSGQRAVKEVIIGTLPRSLQVGGRAGIIERAQQAAELPAAASGRETTAFTKSAELGNASGSAMGEKLNYSGDCVGAVDGALRTADNLDFVDVIEGEVREVHGAAGRIYGRPINKHFDKIGITAVEENGSCPAFGTRPAN